MAFHVVVGAGPTGTATALQLAGSGDDVRVVTRRGTGPTHARIELVAADASDADTLTALTKGAATLVNCATPPYDRWPEETPALAAALLAAAERTGAGYVNLSNTYGYGPVEGPLSDDLPMRPTTIKAGCGRRCTSTGSPRTRRAGCASPRSGRPNTSASARSRCSTC